MDFGLGGEDTIERIAMGVIDARGANGFHETEREYLPAFPVDFTGEILEKRFREDQFSDADFLKNLVAGNGTEKHARRGVRELFRYAIAQFS